jgi:nucleotide-binding universal stress UspA family protein
VISIRRILCPVDFSETSDRALAYAIELGKRFEADVHVVHVYQLPVYAMPDGALVAGPEALAALSTRLQKDLNDLAKRTPGIAKTHLLEGVPHSEIDELAKKISADLIVMGTHGRTGLSRALIGSVAEKVVRTAPVPVLTVHAPPKT